tara:strand:+ start:11831 stop:12010 length:180 start_codon:yes stop_codon:yes gene_type:complete
MLKTAKYFVTTVTLKNNIKKEAFFTTDCAAMAWVTMHNKNGLLESFIIDHKELKMEEFI